MIRSIRRQPVTRFFSLIAPLFMTVAACVPGGGSDLGACRPTRVTRYTSGVVVQPAEQAVSGEDSPLHAARAPGAGGRGPARRGGAERWLQLTPPRGLRRRARHATLTT